MPRTYPRQLSFPSDQPLISDSNWRIFRNQSTNNTTMYSRFRFPGIKNSNSQNNSGEIILCTMTREVLSWHILPSKRAVDTVLRTRRLRFLIWTDSTNQQIVIYNLLRHFVLIFSHYNVTIGHPGCRKGYYRVKRYFCFRTLAVEFYDKVRNCPKCAKTRIILGRNVGSMKLFS